MKIRFLLLIKLFALSGLAYAQVPPGGCASGLNVPGCLPPDDPRLGGSTPPTPTPSVWADRWGAIAFDLPNKVVGVAIDMTSKRKAQKAAIQDCQSRGGGGCVIKTVYQNQCAVVFTGDSESDFISAPTVEEAAEMGERSCKARNDTNCRVYYSGCSDAERIQ